MRTDLNGRFIIEMGTGDVLINTGHFKEGTPTSFISFTDAKTLHRIGEAVVTSLDPKDENSAVRVLFTNETAIDVIIVKLMEAKLELRARTDEYHWNKK